MANNAVHSVSLALVRTGSQVEAGAVNEVAAIQQEIIEPDVVEAAEYVASAWRQGIESIFETGKRLIEIRERWKDERGKWSRLIGANKHEKGLLPFGATHAKRLIRIAEDKKLGPHVDLLPPDSYALDKLRAMTEGRFLELIESGRIHPDMKRAEASAETREEKREEDEKRILKLKPVAGKFHTLVIDPPWDYELMSLAGRAKPGYATMTHEELLALADTVKGWTDSDQHCHLYLWATNNFMTRAVELMAAWGFQHKTVLTWVKPKIGLGSYFRNSTEHVLFGTVGDVNTRTTDIPTHFEAPVGEHSEKPDVFYDIVKRASYPPYGEVFQRKKRDAFRNLFEDEGGGMKHFERDDTPRPLMARPAVILSQAAETRRLINARQLRAICPVSLMTFWRWEQKGKWPRRIKRFGRNYWLLADVMAAIDEMARNDGHDDV